MRWLKRIVLGILGVLVVLVVAVLITVHTNWGREQVRAQVEARMNEAFVGGATIGRLEGSPFGTLVAHDVVINGPDHKPAITIGALHLKLGLLPLLSHQVRLLGVVAEDMNVDLRRDPDGQLQITRLTRPGPKSTWSFDIPSIELRRASIAFDSGTEIMHFDNIALTAGVKMPNGGPLDAHAIVHTTWRERAVPLSLDARVHTSPEGIIDVPWLAASAGQGQEQIRVMASSVRVTTSPATMDFAGNVAIRAPKEAVAKLLPNVRLPDDVQLVVEATPQPMKPTQVALTGSLGRTAIRALLGVDLAGGSAGGVISTGPVDATRLSNGKVEGSGDAILAFGVTKPAPGKLPIGFAMGRVAGEFAELPATAVTFFAASDGEDTGTWASVRGRRLLATIGARVRVVGDAVTLESGTLVAHTDPASASANKAPVHGAVHVDLAASGAVLPKPSLAVAGTIDGRNLRVKDLSIAKLHVGIDATTLPSRPLGKMELRATDVVRGDMFLRELSIDAADRDDGKIAVALRTRPKPNPWLFEADALITPGDTVTVELQRHHVVVANKTDWRGTRGRVSIGKDRIEVRELASASRDGKLAIEGVFHRKSGDLAAKLDLSAFTLDALASGYMGTVDAHADVKRTAGRLAGTVDVKARGIALVPNTGTLDADAKISGRADELLVDATIASAGVGTARLGVDIDAPKNIANVAAWRTLDRGTIRKARLQLEGVDIQKLAALLGQPGEYTGRVEGDLQLSATTIGGVIQIRNIQGPALRAVGQISADLQLSQTAPDKLRPMLTARVDGVGGIEGEALVQIPDRIFDPVAWKRLGRGALRGASLNVRDIAIDPGLLDRLHIERELRGTASLTAEIGEAANTATLAVKIRDLRGAPITKPLDLTLGATIDRNGTAATFTVVSNRLTLLDVKGNVPYAMADLQTDPRGILDAAIEATAKLPDTSAVELLGVFGRTEVTGGTIAGAIEVRGTVGAPTIRAKITGTDLSVPPGPGGKPVKTLQKLAFEASWDGTNGRVALDGAEDAGMLRLTANGNPKNLEAAHVMLEARAFDLVPILAFLPGPAGGAAGRLDARLTVDGLVPKTMRLAGELHLADGRVPIAPAIGTLRRAKIDVAIGDKGLELNVDGRLGGGTVKAEGAVGIEGAMPTNGKLLLTLRNVSPIGVIEPKINADVTASLEKKPESWYAEVGIRNATIDIPSDRGEQLKPPGAPPDMRFTSGKRMTRRPMDSRAPDQPLVEMDVTVYDAQVRSAEVRALVKGKVKVTADAGSFGMVGDLSADHGDLDLFGRRYHVEQASVHFDGPPDPLLDIELSHEFPEVTTFTRVRGRASKPELVLSSDPGSYSQGQLLGFLLGGEPDGGDPNTASARDRATSAGESFVANQIGGYVKDALPVNLDVLRYEAATASSSAAVTVGTWLTDSLFLAYRRRLEARPDENSGEGEFEYWISRRVVIEGTAGDRGYNGVDLLWRKRY